MVSKVALTTVPPETQDWLIWGDGTMASVWDFKIEALKDEKEVWIQFKPEKPVRDWLKIHHPEFFDDETGQTITKKYPYRFFYIHPRPLTRRIMMACDWEGKYDFLAEKELRYLDEIRILNMQVKRMSDTIYFLHEDLQRATGKVAEYVSKNVSIIGELKRLTEPSVNMKDDSRVEQLSYE